MADGKKYKVKIVRVGIGDPFMLGKWQFDTVNGENPANSPLEDLDISLYFDVGNGEFVKFAHTHVTQPINCWTAQGENSDPWFFFGMPFDPSLGMSTAPSSLTVMVKFETNMHNASIELNDSGHSHITFTMDYQDQSTTFDPVSVYYSHSFN